ncbi:DUF4836 family protein [Flexithrix dorotheae]|uniref:DUF4836 family protein n=1 Tax=Flexithrix dorotheae TaxID=70993 RepID=UPI0003704F37|nr:DUF4836 family protein [Flexithrix dorotheae]
MADTSFRNFIKLAGIILFLQAIFSCQSKNTVDAYIPSDAGAVLIINNKNIATKLLFENINDLDFKSILESFFGTQIDSANQYPLGNAILENPTDLGIDLMHNVYLYIGNDNSPKEWVGGIYWKMSNAKHFESFLENKIPPSIDLKITNEDDFKIGELGERKMRFAWNEDILVTFFPLHKKTQSKYIEEKITSIFSLSEDKSILADTNYANLTVNEKDLTLHIKPENITRFTQEVFPTEFLSDDIEYANFTVGFEKGTIECDITQVLEKNSVGYYENLLNGNSHIDLCQSIDGDKLIGFINFKYNKGVVPEFVKAYNLKLAVKALSIITGIPEKDLYTLSDGDLFISYSENTIVEKEVISYEFDDNFEKTEVTKIEKTSQPNFVIGISTGPKMSHILARLEKDGLLLKDRDVYNLKEILGYNTYITHKGSKLLITTDTVVVKNFNDDNLTPKLNNFQKLASKFPISAYLDFDKFNEEFPDISYSKLRRKDITSLSEVLKSTSFYTYPISGTEINSGIQIDFDNENENGFIGLVKFINIILKREEKNRQKLTSANTKTYY